MDTLETLKRKVDTTTGLRSLVHTMKVIAAVNVRQFGKAVESLGEYSDTVQAGIQIVLRGRAVEGQMPPGADETPAAGIVVFGSDQGMCGQFNASISVHALERTEILVPHERRRHFIVVGVRLAAELEARQVQFEKIFPVPGAVEGIEAVVQELAVAIERWNREEGIGQVLLFHNVPQGGAAYRSAENVLLPVDTGWLKTLRDRPWKARVLPVYTMDYETLFSALIREHLFIVLFRTFAESIAAENASRLTAMQSAEKNIEDRLRDLHLEFNRLRQDSITAELLDIVAGYEAMQNKGY